MSMDMDAEIYPISFAAQPKYKPAPNTSAARREIDFTKFSNDNLKFAFDVLCSHYSPWTDAALFEIQQRTARGTWLDLDQPPPPSHTLPRILTVFPLRLLWKQRKKSVGEVSA
jgi:hypothetical protein